jgi:hypothetical protein
MAEIKLTLKKAENDRLGIIPTAKCWSPLTTDRPAG